MYNTEVGISVYSYLTASILVCNSNGIYRFGMELFARERKI